MAPLTREEFQSMLVRAGFYIPASLAGWLTVNTFLPEWLARELASWVAVCVMVGILVAEVRVYHWLEAIADAR